MTAFHRGLKYTVLISISQVGNSAGVLPQAKGKFISDRLKGPEKEAIFFQ